MGWAVAIFLLVQSFFLIPQGGLEGFAAVPKFGSRIMVPRELLTLWSIYALIGYVVIRGTVRKPPRCLFLGLFLAWVAIQVIYPTSYYFRQVFFYISPFGLKIFHYILFFSLGWWLLSGVLTRRDVRIIGTGLVGIACLHALVVLSQWAGHPPILWLPAKWQPVDPKHVVGFIGNTWHLAAYLAFIVPLALDRFPAWWANVFVYLLIGLALYYTRSTAAVMAAVVGVLVYGGREFIRGWKAFALVALVVIIPTYVIAVDRPGKFDWDRYYIWKTTLKMVAPPGFRTEIQMVKQDERFLPPASAFAIGYGPSGYQRVFPAMSGQVNGNVYFNYRGSGSENVKKVGYARPAPTLHAHNEPLQVLFEHGLVGLFLVAGAVWWFVRRTRNYLGLFEDSEVRRLVGVLSAIGTHSLLFQTFHVAQLATVAVVGAAGLFVLTET